MIPAFRTTALATLLSLLSWGASATPTPALPTTGADLTVNFTELGNQAACIGQTNCTPNPISVTTVGDLHFQNAWAWNAGDAMKWGAGDPRPDPDDAGGFLINRNRTPGTVGDLVISLEDPIDKTASQNAAPGSLPGRYFTNFAISLFTNALSLTVDFLDSSGGLLDSASVTTGGGQLLWTSANDDAPTGTRTLAFRTGGGVLGIDNLQLWLSAGTNPGTVPEPSSYALVGLALLAAGAASRRSRR